MPGHLTPEHPLSTVFGGFDLEDVVGLLVHQPTRPGGCTARGLYGMELPGDGGKPRLYPWRNTSIPLPNRRDVNKGWPGQCLSLCGTIVAVGNPPIGRVRADWWLLPSSDHTRSRLGHRDDLTDVPSPTIKGRIPFMVRRTDNGKRSARGSSWDPYGHNGVNGPAP